jgi:hypothetical protein
VGQLQLWSVAHFRNFGRVRQRKVTLHPFEGKWWTILDRNHQPWWSNSSSRISFSFTNGCTIKLVYLFLQILNICVLSDKHSFGKNWSTGTCILAANVFDGMPLSLLLNVRGRRRKTVLDRRTQEFMSQARPNINLK